MKNTSGRFKFGVICGSNGLNAWQKTTVQNLVAEDDIDLKFVVIDQSHIIQKRNKILTSWLWRFYFKFRIERLLAALQPVKSDELFKDTILEQCNFISTADGSFAMPSKVIALLKNAELDFMLDFSSLPFSGQVLSIPKHGLWNFQFGDPEKYRKSAPCFWEIYKQEKHTSAYLQRLTEDVNQMEILHEGHLKTAISYRKNLDKILHECSSWPLKIATELRSGQTEIQTKTLPIWTKKVWRSPVGLHMIVFPFVQLKSVLQQVWKKLFFTDYWNVGIVHAPIQDFLDTSKKQKVHWFPDLGKDRFMADPFGIIYKDKLHILYEDLKFDEGIGKTASLLYNQGLFEKNEIVIDEPFHMSYPFLFKQGGEIYCIPETYQANQVRLYKASDFPDTWVFEKVLIENYAGIDSTLFEYEGIWYLFSTNKNSGPHYNLNIHFATDCFGPWEAHPKNPVKTDIRSARPAGTLFEHKGEIYRPSMDYSEKIEGRISINKVELLSKNNFKEEAHQVMQPFEDCYFSDKVHTLSKVGSYTLVDGAKELFIFGNFKAFSYKIKRVFNSVFGR